MTLEEFIREHENSYFYIKVLKHLLKKVLSPPSRIHRPIRNEDREEMKEEQKRGRVGSGGANIDYESLKDDVLTEEEQELIELYGNKICSIRWYFENTDALKKKKKNKADCEVIDGKYYQPLGDDK